jgi:DNA-binding protein YbaB
MFDKLKQLKKARDIQKALENREIAHEKEGVSVIVGGKLKIKEIKINPSLDKERQEVILKDCLNEAMEKVQMMAAREISNLGGF